MTEAPRHARDLPVCSPQRAGWQPAPGTAWQPAPGTAWWPGPLMRWSS